MLSWILSACALILAVLLIRAAARGRAPASVIYALWLLVALRLLIPGGVSLGRDVPTVANVIERAPVVRLSERLAGADRLELTPSGEVEAHFSGSGAVVVAESATESEFDFMSLLLGLAKLAKPVWLCGSAAAAAAFVLSWARFSRQMRRSRTLLDCGNTPLRVYVSEAVDTPCLFGLIDPAIYLPPEAAGDETLLRHAVAHETAHYRQLDHIWCVVRCACLALHWYNPLVWLAADISRRDCELACDESAVRRLGESERALYGRSLISLTCEKARGASIATAMSAKPNELKERIIMLTKKKRSVLALFLAVLLALTATACSFAGSEDNANAGSLTYNEDEDCYYFTSPGGAEYIYIRGWNYASGKWALARNCCIGAEAEGRLRLDKDMIDKTVNFSIDFPNVEGALSLSGSMDFAQGAEADSWACALETSEHILTLENETALYIFGASKDGGPKSVSPAYFEKPELIPDDDYSYFCVTLCFSASAPEYAKLQQREGLPYGRLIFDYSAPESAKSILIQAHQLTDGVWNTLDYTVYACEETEGSIAFNFNWERARALYGVAFGDADEYVYKAIDYGLYGGVASRLGGEIELNREYPVASVYTDSGNSSPGLYPSLTGSDMTDGFIAFTVAFCDERSPSLPGEPADPGPQATGEPAPEASPSATPEPQSAELVGFTAYPGPDDVTYDEILSLWVHDYAANLVMGVPKDDPAGCSGVSIKSSEPISMAVTEPESIVARIQLDCRPRDAEKFAEFMGALAGSEDTGGLLLDRYIGLQLMDDGSWECVWAGESLEGLQMWGSLSLVEYGSEDYISELAASGASDWDIIWQVNYFELEDISEDSWMTLLEALDNEAVSPDKAEGMTNADQYYRDLCVMLAAASSDGAYTEWICDILDRQREASPDDYEWAYNTAVELIEAMDLDDSAEIIIAP